MTYAPPPITIRWRNLDVRLKHDDAALREYTPRVTILRSAMELVSSVEGLRTILPMALGEWYDVHVADDASWVGLRRKA